jgi:hypothetical protein
LFAYVALFAWPAVCIALFVALPVEVAALSSLLGGFMLLPSGLQVDLPLLPPLDKTSITAVSTLALCLMKGSPEKAPRQSVLVYLLAFGFVVAPIFTSLGNSYELQTAAGSIPGFYPLDGVKIAGRNVILLAPFYIGTRYFYSIQARLLLLKALPIAALFYSLPMLFEVRMSPQLHRWVYGYFPHQFSQMVRGGGFRPLVFMEHGLQVALFTSMALLAAVVAMRGKWQILRLPASAVAGYLGIVLVLCKSLGALIYGVVLAPIVMFTRPRFWTRIACAVLLVLCAYPALRGYNLIPVHHAAEAANSISGNRAKSLQQRIDNEDLLLAKANQKALFGWGTWGRNRVYDQWTGKDISVTDGAWIIEFGTFGWLGYLSLFGLLTLGAFRAARAVGDQTGTASIAIGGLSLLLAANAIDLIPNSNLSPLTFLIAGSIARSVRVRKARTVPLRRRAGGSPVTASH